MKIGVFDSGFGGLAVFKDLRQSLPEYDFVYLGDSKRAPYGSRSTDSIKEFSHKACEYLFKEQQCALIIVACHTASNVALRYLQNDYLKNSAYQNLRILGVTIPLVEKACQKAKKRVGVLATKATCSSKTFTEEILKRRPELLVFYKAAPLLVSFIEEGMIKSPECKSLIRKYLMPLKQNQIDTLILGCTHFPLLYKEFITKSGKHIEVLNTGSIVNESLLNYLKRHPEIDNQLSRHKSSLFLTTDDPRTFSSNGKLFLGYNFEAFKISLD